MLPASVNQSGSEFWSPTGCATGPSGQSPQPDPHLFGVSSPPSSSRRPPAHDNESVSWVRSPDKAATELGGRTFWSASLDELLAATAATTEGLSPEEAARRLAADGPNTIEVAQALRGLRLFLAQFRSPIVLILVAATALSMALGDVTDGSIILVIVAASGALGFWQEHTAGQAVDALLAQVRVEAEVLRGGREISLPVEDVVVGDVLVLSAGDVVPADCRVIESHGLLIDEAALTGESYPVEKRPGVVGAETPLAGRANSLFMGTHVVSGTGQAIVVTTGRATEFGAVSEQLGARRLRTGFERGITAFGVLLVRAMVVLVSAIFVINLVLHRPWSNRCCSRWRWPSASPRSCCPPS